MWKLSPNGRLDHWKAFRSSIGSMPLSQAVQECNDFWQRAPFTPYYLDYREISKWPNPWQLIYENHYCDLAKALAIVYTLHLSDHKNCDLEVRVFRQHGTLHQFNGVWINNGKYVLNLESSQVVNKKSIPESLVKIIEYSSADLGLDRY